MRRKDYVVDFITNIVGDKIKAELIVERLTDEGLLHLGFGDAEVDAVIDKFQQTFGNTKTTKYDRFAASRLTKKYGSQAVVGIIGLLGALEDRQYKPVVNNVTELETKWQSVLNFLRKEGKGTETIEV